MSEKPKKIIIVGSGPAGLTAAIYSARANLNPLIIEGSNPGGQLMNTSIVENWPGEKSIMGPKLMLNMKEQAESLKAEFLSESVTKVDFTKKPFTIWTDRNKELKAEAVIVATGATPKRLNVPGEDEYWGKGITTCAICDGAFYKDKKVVVIGGGDTAMEDASFLKRFTKEITIIQIMDKLTASHAMQQRVLNDPDITILYNSTVTAFSGNGNRLTEVTINNQKTTKQTKIAADGAFLAIGMKPNTVPFQGQLDMDKWGFVQVADHTKTSVEGVFAAGDLEDFRYRQAITAAGAGCMAALDAQRYIEQIKQNS
jgi:thioredoxin reductase (NADPH)